VSARCACGGCRHFVVQAARLEAEIAGLKILSSAFGSVRADTGLCRLRDLFCVPEHGCPQWQAVPVAGAGA
jgi:hypothetical protein